jgi:hypothetical protein
MILVFGIGPQAQAVVERERGEGSKCFLRCPEVQYFSLKDNPADKVYTDVDEIRDAYTKAGIAVYPIALDVVAVRIADEPAEAPIKAKAKAKRK